LDSFGDDLSHCLHLLTGFTAVEVGHSGRLTAMGNMRPLVVVERDPTSDSGLGL
jgi:hypothetical protein